MREEGRRSSTSSRLVPKDLSFSSRYSASLGPRDLVVQPREVAFRLRLDDALVLCGTGHSVNNSKNLTQNGQPIVLIILVYKR